MISIAAGGTVATLLGDGFEDCGLTRSILADQKGDIALELDIQPSGQTRDIEREACEVQLRMFQSELALGNTSDASEERHSVSGGNSSELFTALKV